MPPIAGNVAFKVTWVYGKKGPFSSACTADGRRINVQQAKRTWCSQPQNRCCQAVRAGNRKGPLSIDDSSYPCNDVMVFRWWAFSSGYFHHGAHKGQPIPMRHARPGKFAFLTSRPADVAESERRVIGCFRISTIETRDEFWVESDPKGERLRVKNFSQAPRFWDFYRQSGGPRWGTGLFRYLDDSVAARLVDAVRGAASR